MSGADRIEYRLELCDTSGEHRPIAIFRAASPFPPVGVGVILARYCLNLTPFDGDRSPVWGVSDPI